MPFTAADGKPLEHQAVLGERGPAGGLDHHVPVGVRGAAVGGVELGPLHA